MILKMREIVQRGGKRRALNGDIYPRELRLIEFSLLDAAK
jgi:hypothetical protein